jgi:hypothetical protein
MNRLRLQTSLLLCGLTLLLVAASTPALAAPSDYFVIRVVDAQTGRGVPLVELRTTDEVVYYTDSAGVAAFLEPGRMNRKVFFTVTSPGYEFPADGFGFHGTALTTVPGKTTTLKINRLNIAERLYRVTGAGIYRDSVLAGLPTPLRQPLLSGDVDGQDSVLAVPYHGLIHWFWGDTSRPDYPLGNFGTSGATSPSNSNPDRGIDLTYFTDAGGFSRPMIPIEGPGPVWISAVSTIEHGSRLVGYYSRVEGLVRALERGLVVYDDRRNVFERAARFDAAKPLPLDGHPLTASEAGASYLVGTLASAAPLPCLRVAANLEAMKDAGAYESYTCLKAGTSEVERDAAGHVVYGWKRGAAPLSWELQERLTARGALQPGEGFIQLRDVQTGKRVRPHAGSVYWNRYRGRWVMIFGQAGGDVSNVGEIWFAEADTPVGPWTYARKIATHPKMDFYNPTQHPFFDEDGGPRIYFEGTYVNTFSGNPVATPRYNYNQIMYRLALDDARLSLPLPVYRLAGGKYRTRDGLTLPRDAAAIRAIPFYAVPPERAHAGMIPVYAADGSFQPSPPTPGARPLFYALPAAAPDSANTEPLKDRAGRTIATVWKNPQTVLTLDFGLTPNTEP